MFVASPERSCLTFHSLCGQQYPSAAKSCPIYPTLLYRIMKQWRFWLRLSIHLGSIHENKPAIRQDYCHIPILWKHDLKKGILQFLCRTFESSNYFPVPFLISGEAALVPAFSLESLLLEVHPSSRLKKSLRKSCCWAMQKPAKSIRRPSLKSSPVWYWNDIVYVRSPTHKFFDDPSRAIGSNSRFAPWPLLCICWISKRWVVFCVIPTIWAVDSFPIPPPPVLYFNIEGFMSKWVESETNSKAYDLRFQTGLTWLRESSW